MTTEQRPSPISQATDPLRRDIRSPGMWNYLINYILIGASGLIIVMEIIESGAWRKLWAPLIMLCLAIGNLARLQSAESKRP